MLNSFLNGQALLPTQTPQSNLIKIFPPCSMAPQLSSTGTYQLSRTFSVLHFLFHLADYQLFSTWTLVALFEAMSLHLNV